MVSKYLSLTLETLIQIVNQKTQSLYIFIVNYEEHAANDYHICILSHFFKNRFTSKKLCKQSNDAIKISTALWNILQVTLTLKKTRNLIFKIFYVIFFSPQFWLWLWKINHRCKSTDTNTKIYLGETIEGWVSKKFLLITDFCGQ